MYTLRNRAVLGRQPVGWKIVKWSAEGGDVHTAAQVHDYAPFEWKETLHRNTAGSGGRRRRRRRVPAIPLAVVHPEVIAPPWRNRGRGSGCEPGEAPTDRRTVPAYKNRGPTLFRRQNFTSHRRTYTRSLRTRTPNPHRSRRFCRRLLHRYLHSTRTTATAPRRTWRRSLTTGGDIYLYIYTYRQTDDSVTITMVGTRHLVSTRDLVGPYRSRVV